MAIAQLSEGVPVFFGSDVGQESSRELGILSRNLYNIKDIINIKDTMDKATKLEYRESAMTHAMMFLGVNLDENWKGNRWKVENSWGDSTGNKGIYLLTDDWFNSYVYQVVINKKHLKPEELEAYNENKYYMVVGASRNNRGLALIYESADLYHWNFLNVLAESRGEWGFMWECPDFYQLGDKYVLTFSPMGSGDHTSVYLTGDFDYKTGKFDWHISGEMDWGFDFYAPQSMVAPDGRRLIVAWANEWEWMPLFKDWGPTYQEGWCGFFNVIREVRMCKDGTLAFVPVEEMEKIRENKFTQREIQVTETPQQLKAGDGISFEMKFTLDLEETDADRVELKLRCGKEKESRCIFDLKNGELLVDRSCADGWSVGTSRSVLKVSEKSLDVHIFSDQSSLEIFTDQYRNNHSNNIFAGNDQDAISISAFGGRAVIRDYEAYGLQECFDRIK